MAFKHILIVLVVDRILLSESLFFKHRFKKQGIEHGSFPKFARMSEPGLTFNQKLDHFSPSDTRTFKQTFYTEESFYTKAGPVYLLIGDEKEADPSSLKTGYWRKHGEKNHALLFLLEHRFYGSSQPFRDLSTKNLRYLSTSQALADLATFIVAMNKKYKLRAKTKWIVFGGSYAGNLAAWMRLKYPHLVHGAVASSAPVLAKMDFFEYMDVVSDALAAYNPECRNDVAQANQFLSKKVRTPKGRLEIRKIFNLCDPLDGDTLNTSYFFSNLADVFNGKVQYDYNGENVKSICDKMLENATHLNPVKRFAKVVNMYLKDNNMSCFPINYKEFAEDIQNTDINEDRAWYYQTCTEFGYFQTSNWVNSTFSEWISLDLYETMCTQAYSKLFDKSFVSKAVDSTNQFFGGLNINTPRIVFVNGLLDPWHRLSVISSNKTPNIDVVLIKGASHCNDMSSPDEDDSADVKKARAKIVNILDRWLVAGP